MKTLLSTLLFTCFTITGYSQSIQTLSMFMDIDASNNSIYVGTLGFGVLKSTNAGDSWLLASSGIEGKDIRSLAISPSNQNELIVTVWNNCCPIGGFLGVFKSTNGGTTWTSSSSGLSGDLGPIAYDPANTVIIYVGGYFGAFYKSTNGGTNWSALSGVSGDINSLFVQPNSTVWAGGQGGLRKSTNGGSTWQSMSGIPSGNVYEIIGINSDPNTIFINIDLSGYRGIYKTTNGGNSWSQVGQSIGGGDVLSFGNNSNTVFVGNKKGCYKTSDGGNNWSVVDTTSLLLAHQGSIANNNLYIVSGGGIFAINNVVTSLSDETEITPIGFSLKQNFPNPFNPSTTIEFRIYKNDFVQLSIYDINGELVKNLINEELNIGVYTVKWDGTDIFGRKVASGSYYYKIQTGESFDAKKMILIK